MKQKFNLVLDPWIKVMDLQNREQTVSLTDVFKNAKNYRMLCGDMASQDLAVLRFLLSILLAVYTRFDADDKQYSWLGYDGNTWCISEEVNEQDLFDTWNNLYKRQEFSDLVVSYLNKYQEKFDLFGKYPFYQVTRDVYDKNVGSANQVATGKGTVSIKQINRVVSESNNTPAIFSPKSDNYKNKVGLDELTRWIITYQNYTGTTDKTKVKVQGNPSSSKGFLYGLNPVFIEGDSLFETLMLNLTLLSDVKGKRVYTIQKPVWEYENIDEYLSKRKKAIVPDNLSELYTIWSRILYIEWDNEQPTIFSAGLPKLESKDIYLEQMTTWRKAKDKTYQPAVKNKNTLDIAMWRNFGQYVRVYVDSDTNASSEVIPGVIIWLNTLKAKNYIPRDMILKLKSVNLISDGKASQAPYAETSDTMVIDADVLFDENRRKAMRWPDRIEEMVLLTQAIGRDFWAFAKDISQLNGESDSSFANKLSRSFYSHLNQPFYDWLAGLKVSDNPNKKIAEWKKILDKIVKNHVQQVFALADPTTIQGKDNKNIFTSFNRFNQKVYKHLN